MFSRQEQNITWLTNVIDVYKKYIYTLIIMANILKCAIKCCNKFILNNGYNTLRHAYKYILNNGIFKL